MIMSSTPSKQDQNSATGQKGFILVVTLIVLVAMTLLGIALVRSVDTATQVANSLAFRQSVLASADRGTELAIQWLAANTDLLTADSPGNGYYATEQTGTDFTGQQTPDDTSDDVDWTGASGSRRAFPVATADAAGNSVSYIIQRLCDAPGAYNEGTIQCATASASGSSSGSSKGGASYGSYNITGKTMIYYRITSRAVGPRNSVSYVQTLVQVEY